MIELYVYDGNRMKGVRLKERRGGRAHDCFSFSLLELIALSRGPAKFGGRPAMQEMGKFGLFGFWVDYYFLLETDRENKWWFIPGGGRSWLLI
jgi:hypothetical protein